MAFINYAQKLKPYLYVTTHLRKFLSVLAVQGTLNSPPHSPPPQCFLPLPHLMVTPACINVQGTKLLLAVFIH